MRARKWGKGVRPPRLPDQWAPEKNLPRMYALLEKQVELEETRARVRQLESYMDKRFKKTA